LIGLSVAGAVQLKLESKMSVNPIRRIVNLMQKMQEELEGENKKAEEAHEAQVCFCKNGGEKLKKDIAAGEEEAKELVANHDAAKARSEQLNAEVDQHRKDRDEANAAIEKATGIRNKEKEEFDDVNGDAKQNIDAMDRAVAAISKGTGGAFIQTGNNLRMLKRAMTNSNAAEDMEKDLVVAFLTQGEAASAPSDQIVGILKGMRDESAKDLGSALEHEEAAVKAFGELASAKNDEIAAATAGIEHKVVRAGELAVEAANLKNEGGNNLREIEANRKTLANMEDTCATEAKEYDAAVAGRNEELGAIGEAMKILNNDDAMDIFKKTLPSMAQTREQPVALLQLDVPPALQAYGFVQSAAENSLNRSPTLNLLAYMLRVGKVDFSKILGMIDEMVVHLGQEQKDDDAQLKYCDKELNQAGDNKKTYERDLKDIQANIDELKETISEHEDTIKSVQARIKETEGSMKEATAMRKNENADYKVLMGQNAAAKQILELAKNKLNKVYNPAMYKPPPVRQLTEEERIAQSMGEVLPTEAPKFIPGTNIPALLQKNKKSGGVIGLMDMMIKDVDKQMKEAEMDEDTAQKDYERLLADSQDSLAADNESVTSDASALADDQESLSKAGADRRSKADELGATNENIKNLHGECDFLSENYDFRKEARTNEIEALKNGKAVLSGADFS